MTDNASAARMGARFGLHVRVMETVDGQTVEREQWHHDGNGWRKVPAPVTWEPDPAVKGRHRVRAAWNMGHAR